MSSSSIPQGACTRNPTDAELKNEAHRRKSHSRRAALMFLLVLDATTGQNGLAQALRIYFDRGLTGIILTKLDGTAKAACLSRSRANWACPILSLAR